MIRENSRIDWTTKPTQGIGPKGAVLNYEKQRLEASWEVFGIAL
jgi:hypothetical protein